MFIENRRLMNVDKFLENKISLITLLTGLAYVAYMSVRFGESIYYGYPVEFIWTDINSLLVSLVKSSFVILFVSCLIYRSIISGREFISNIIGVVGGILGASLWNLKRVMGDIQGVIIAVLIFLIVFASAHLIKKVIDDVNNVRNLFFAFLVYVLMCVLLGNWWSSILPVLTNGKGELIVANYKDQVIKIVCIKGNKKVILSTLGDLEISKTRHTYLERNWFESRCANEIRK